MSVLKSAATGVPQGSCLPPILFILYTADMFIADRAGGSPAIGSYADDVMVMASKRCADAISIEQTFGNYHYNRPNVPP